MGFRIRTVGPGDFKALLDYDWTPLLRERDTIYMTLCHDQRRYCLAAEDEKGAALGYILAARSAEGGSIFVFHLHVERNSRRRGVGTRLLGALERRARRDGARRIWLLCPERVAGFYAARGFKRAEGILDPEAARHVQREKHAFVMAKTLARLQKEPVEGGQAGGPGRRRMNR